MKLLLTIAAVFVLASTPRLKPGVCLKESIPSGRKEVHWLVLGNKQVSYWNCELTVYLICSSFDRKPWKDCRMKIPVDVLENDQFQKTTCPTQEFENKEDAKEFRKILD